MMSVATNPGEFPASNSCVTPVAAESTTSELYEEFLRAYTAIQLPVHAYIRTLIHNRVEADDVFQETSLVLWRRYAEFSSEGSFLKWALGISRRQVLKYWRTKRRDQQVFSAIFLERLSEAAYDVAGETDRRQESLDLCLRQLTERQRELLRQFYGEGLSGEAIAAQWNRSVHAVYKSLNVMRRTLSNCVERRLATEVR